MGRGSDLQARAFRDEIEGEDQGAEDWAVVWGRAVRDLESDGGVAVDVECGCEDGCAAEPG